MGTPAKLNLEKARAIRAMRAAGFGIRELGRLFQVSDTLIGLVLQEKVWKDGGCKGCWGPLPPNRPSRLCDQCRPQVCQQCKGPKSPSRLSLNCVGCDREKNRAHKDHRPHVCRACAEALPPERRDVYCSECRRDEDSFYREWQAERNKGKVCSRPTCENPLPESKWWRSRRCRACQQQHERLRRSLSRRLCGICERRLNDQERGLCRECRTVDDRIRRRGTENAACPMSGG